MGVYPKGHSWRAHLLPWTYHLRNRFIYIWIYGILHGILEYVSVYWKMIKTHIKTKFIYIGIYGILHGILEYVPMYWAMIKTAQHGPIPQGEFYDGTLRFMTYYLTIDSYRLGYKHFYMELYCSMCQCIGK